MAAITSRILLTKTSRASALMTLVCYHLASYPELLIAHLNFSSTMKCILEVKRSDGTISYESLNFCRDLAGALSANCPENYLNLINFTRHEEANLTEIYDTLYIYLYFVFIEEMKSLFQLYINFRVGYDL